MATSKSTQHVGLRLGFKSGLEETLASVLQARGIHFTYEKLVLKYERPARVCKYTPDFHLPHNTRPDHPGIIVETKGQFVTEDRQKQLLVKQQHPERDIRFVFSRSKARISKQSTTTYAMWCERNGFKFADRTVPDAWLQELGYA